ncbi:unnamed protein product [Callosobruchus maculatus]|uniref:Uncharacterized protein n=2 Tax=Callosobruchus maculatus TaxID=64391 RepID=A0A653DNL8_CALMS|nr:unnamed protein product [Callosobruchus maculatus]
MQELDNEILGKPVDDKDEKQKVKKVKKKKRKVSACDSKASDTDKEQPQSSGTEEIKEGDNENKPPVSAEDVTSSVPTENEKLETSPNTFQYRKRPRSRSPNRRFMNRRRLRNFPPNVPQPPPMPPFIQPQPQFMVPGPQMMPFPPHPFNPFGPPIIQNPMPRPFFDRPLSPLGINTESIAATAMAPLSPRSAAFVLQNKAIVEKRKRSPRRSYSRSPSRSLSRSPRRSPRRSLTPIRRVSRSPRRLSPIRRSLSPRRRSLSPRRRSLTPRKRSLSPRKRSLSPRKRSMSPRKRSLSPRRRPLSPRKRSVSPRNRAMSPRRRSPLSPRRRPLSPLPRRRSISPRRKRPVKPRDAKEQEEEKKNARAPVHERLGNKGQKAESKEKEGEEKEGNEPAQKKEDDKLIDPVLEARRKKFESNEIKKKEGIIRLKPKDDKPKEDKSTEEDKPKDEKPKDIKPKEEKPTVTKPKEDKPKESQEPKTKDTPTAPAGPASVSSTAASSAPKPSSSITSTSETSVTSTTPPIPSSTTAEDKPKAAEPKKKLEDIPEFEELERLLNAPLPELDDIVNPKVDDIFSDEDSASDNEGRFKAKQTGEKMPVLSFSKLVNGVKQEIKAEALPDSQPNRRRDRNYDRDRRRRERPAPQRKEEKPEPVRPERATKLDSKKPETSEKPSPKQRLQVKSTRRPSPVMDKKFERKIEIKIKNPSKYEKQTKVKEEEKPKHQEQDFSKVEVKKEVESEDEDEPEIIIENDSDDEEDVVAERATKGDLRAQLSKKRAQKLQRVPVEEVSSRLLQYALEGAVFKKSKKKKKKEKDISSSELAAIKKLVHADYFTRKFCLSFKTERKVRVYKHKSFRLNYGFLRRPDGKLPIQLRLGMLDPEVYLEVKPKRKSRKRKNREVVEQVYHFLLKNLLSDSSCIVET